MKKAMQDDEPSMDSVDRYEYEIKRKAEAKRAAVANMKKPLKRQNFDSDDDYRFMGEGAINHIEDENKFLYDRIVGNIDV